MSARATAGQQSTVPILIANDGTAPADNVELSGSGPSGWKIEFDQARPVDRIAPGQTSDVNALITRREKSLAGDYMATMRAASRGETASTQFRVTVSTSTTWGMVGRRRYRCGAADHGRCGVEVRTAMSEPVITARGLTKRYGDVASSSTPSTSTSCAAKRSVFSARTAPARPPPS